MDDFRLFQLAVFDFEANAGLYPVKPLLSRGSRVDEKHLTQRRNPVDPQNVAVATDEYVRRTRFQTVENARRPSSRPSSDVDHPDRDTIDLEKLFFRHSTSD